MATISPEIELIVRKFIALLRNDKRISKIFLYGSHAKGLATEWSDIDLAVVSPDFSGDLFEERVRLMKSGLMIDDRIEPSPFRPEDFDENDPLVSEINKSGIEIDSMHVDG